MSDKHYPYESKTLRALGVRSWINASNWSTTIGGSYLHERVLAAINEVAGTWVDMYELLAKAGGRVAALCQVDAAYITCGAAAGIELAVAACMAGQDEKKWRLLPCTDGIKNEVAIPRGHHIKYSAQWQAAGARLVDYGKVGFWKSEPSEIADIITDKTCCLAYVESIHVDTRQVVKLEDVIEVAHRFDLPVVLDSAAMLPPVSNLHKYAEMGVDITIFSAGKAIKALNSTGIILGKGERGKEIIEAIRAYSFPNPGWGRSRKVSKEQIVGLVTALEIFVEEGDRWYEEQMKTAEYLAEKLDGIPNVETCIIPNDANLHEHPNMAHVPRIKVEWDVDILGLTSSDLERKMAAEDPPVLLKTTNYFNHYTNKAWCLIDTFHLREGEKEVVVERLKRILAPGRERR